MMPVMNESLMNATIAAEHIIKTNGTMSPMEFFQEPLKLTTEDLVQLCGSFDVQTKVAAFVGLGLVLVAFVWFGKYGKKLASNMSDTSVGIIDKLLLMLIALCFAWIIAKLFYGG